MHLDMLVHLWEKYVTSIQDQETIQKDLLHAMTTSGIEEETESVKCSQDFTVTDSNVNTSEQSQLLTLGFLEACFERARSHFENREIFKIIVLAFCEASASDNVEIRLKGITLLVKTAANCYKHLEEYIDLIVMSAIAAITSSDKRVQAQGIEFWKVLSQIEDPRDSEGRRLEEKAESSSFFVKKHLAKLIPTLFEELVRGELLADFSVSDLHTYQDTDMVIGISNFNDQLIQVDCNLSGAKNTKGSLPVLNREDAWTPPKEIIIYFSEICEDYPDAIDYHVLPLVQSQIKHAEWKRRYAALWSLLVFLKQMDSNHAEKVLEPYFPLVRECLKDSRSRIRNTALWVISWMLDKYPKLIMSSNSQDLQLLINELIICLHDNEGRVSPSSCTTLTSLIRAAYSLTPEMDVRPLTFILSPYYKMVAYELVKAANRRGLLMAAFVALREILMYAPNDCYWVILDTADQLLESLRKTIDITEGRRCRCYENLRSLLCSVLHSIVQTLKEGETATKELCHKYMNCILKLVTQFPTGFAREEALKSASSVAILMGCELDRHLEKLIPYLTSSISSFSKEDPALPLAIHLVGNLFRALKAEAVPYINRLLGPLLTLTDRNRDVKMEVRIGCVATFGQIATAVGRMGFQVYLTSVLRRLLHCCELSIEVKEENDCDKILRETLRQTCFETLSRLIQCILPKESQPFTFEQSSSSLCFKNISILILSVVDSKTELPERTLNAAAHLIGNLLLEFGIQKALVNIQLDIIECKRLLTETIKRNTISEEVGSVCRAALFELEISGRQLN